MGGENAADFFGDDSAREGGIVSLEIDAGGLDFAHRVQTECLADGFGHGGGFVFFHESDGVFHLIGVLFIACICVIARPQGISVIAAVVGIPAEDRPQFLPRQRLFSIGSQNSGGQQPRITVGVGIELVPGQDAEPGQVVFQAVNPRAPGGDVSARAAEAAPGGS